MPQMDVVPRQTGRLTFDRNITLTVTQLASRGWYSESIHVRISGALSGHKFY
jgi:hypothetical protein